MEVKDKSVVWHLFAPEMYVALAIIDEVYVEVTGAEAVLTSGMDGQHMQGSLHYCGRAADFRLPQVRGLCDMLVCSLQERLGDAFDVILESDHIHVE